MTTRKFKKLKLNTTRKFKKKYTKSIIKGGGETDALEQTLGVPAEAPAEEEATKPLTPEQTQAYKDYGDKALPRNGSKPDGYIYDNELNDYETDLINAQQQEELDNPELKVHEARNMKLRADEDKKEIQKSLATLDLKLSNNQGLAEFENNEMTDLSVSNGLIKKMIVNSIANYNVIARRTDDVNPFFTRNKTKSKYPCGTVTCKRRGQKIKNALISLLKISPEALGNIGVLNSLVNGFNAYTVGMFKSDRRDRDFRENREVIAPQQQPVAPLVAPQKTPFNRWF